MSRIQLFLAAAFFGIAVFIFASAEGPRRIYSGGLFAVLGTTLLVNAIKGKKDRSD